MKIPLLVVVIVLLQIGGCFGSSYLPTQTYSIKNEEIQLARFSSNGMYAAIIYKYFTCYFQFALFNSTNNFADPIY